MAVDFAYFVLVAAYTTTIALPRLVVRYLNSKPPLLKTLVDLVNIDTATTLTAACIGILSMSTLTFLHESFEMGVNYQLHFAISIWYQFFTQALILYSTYNVVVRYIYVYNHRIILENYSDELLRKLIFVLTSLVSGIICLISYANDMRAEQYILVKGSSEIPFTRMEHIYRILLSISIAVNFVLAVALKRKVGNWEEEDEAKAKVSTMKKIFTVLVLMTAITTLRFVLGKKSPYVVPTMGAICVDISLIIYILSKDPLKKFVKKKCLEIFNVSCSSSVSPSPTKI